MRGELQADFTAVCGPGCWDTLWRCSAPPYSSGKLLWMECFRFLFTFSPWRCLSKISQHCFPWKWILFPQSTCRRKRMNDLYIPHVILIFWNKWRWSDVNSYQEKFREHQLSTYKKRMGYTTSHWFFSICPQTSSILFSAPYFAPQKLASPQLPCRMDCCSGLANGRHNWKLRVEESGRVFPCGSDARTLEAVGLITHSPATPTELHNVTPNLRPSGPGQRWFPGAASFCVSPHPVLILRHCAYLYNGAVVNLSSFESSKSSSLS